MLIIVVTLYDIESVKLVKLMGALSMCVAAVKNLGRCMLDYGGKRTAQEYMNNTCKIEQSWRLMMLPYTGCGGGVAY